MLYYAEQPVGVTNLKLFPKSVPAFPANMPLSILIIRGQLKININSEGQIFLSLKYIDIY